MTNRQYITTAIDYPNAVPHMGHVLEKVLADVLARWFRLRGDEVKFQIGTDEHGTKIQQTAKKAGVTPMELVDRNVPFFQELYSKLGISYDNFIRTTDQKKHWPTVTALWVKLREAGVLEQRSYTGLYCSGCERFVTKKDLIDGKCPDHNIEPQEVTETNWFFTLKGKEEELKKILSDGTYTIIPPHRAAETLQLISGGLEDVSFSRPRTTLDWGVPVPGDDEQVMYVWCDALTNYISGIGLLTDHAEEKWWDDATVTHVIGKDIARFHALIWPAMLRDAGIRVPDQLLIHGFVTSEGKKMSKSLGNVVNPEDVIAKYPVDALRFYLTHEIPVGNDGDFSWKRFGEVYQSKLGNQLGNMLNRVLVMLKKEEGDLTIAVGGPEDPEAAKQWKQYGEYMDAFEIHKAAQQVTDLIAQLNEAFNTAAPWTIKDNPAKRLEVLSGFAECLRHISLMLLPFIPGSAATMARQLGVPYADRISDKGFVITEEMKTWKGVKDWQKVGEPSILFPKVEEAITA